MPSEAASDPNLVRDFLDRGMNIMRINCAHDSVEEWLRMVENLQAAQEETGKACKIAFDLAGPKLRTGPLAPCPGSSVGNRCETNSGKSRPLPTLRSATTNTLLRVIRSPFQLRGLFFVMPGQEMSLNSPILAAASAPCMSLKSTNHAVFARTTERATSSRVQNCGFCGRKSVSAKTRWTLCRKSNTPFR